MDDWPAQRRCRAASAPRRARRACGAGRLATGRRGRSHWHRWTGLSGEARMLPPRRFLCATGRSGKSCERLQLAVRGFGISADRPQPHCPVQRSRRHRQTGRQPLPLRSNGSVRPVWSRRQFPTDRWMWRINALRGLRRCHNPSITNPLHLGASLPAGCRRARSRVRDRLVKGALTIRYLQRLAQAAGTAGTARGQGAKSGLASTSRRLRTRLFTRLS